MIERVRSLYLRNEQKYDRWGAQGKILAALEVFRSEGIVMGPEKLERYVNLAFPRTFSCQRTPSPGEKLPSPKTMDACRGSLFRLFTESGLPPSRAGKLALEETAEIFCLDVEFLKSYLK